MFGETAQKSYPERILLKHQKCPGCGDDIGHPRLRVVENQVRAACHNEGCGFSLELFFLGDLRPEAA